MYNSIFVGYFHCKIHLIYSINVILNRVEKYNLSYYYSERNDLFEATCSSVRQYELMDYITMECLKYCDLFFFFI